ncbi:MAG: s-methyl-5-thioribose-1-phosphate isomerase [Oscillospiraceae bacterium]|nr:s-methyl-5-thioribose-1-phosphate isomerase [Oscillospiraceae bacterium]
MERADKDLAFMLRYENVAWYENGEVRILDRRIYPQRVEFVVCKGHQEVARAIADMVTQSAGPYTAAAMGMALAAHECRDMTAENQTEYLKNAAFTLSHARPTTVGRMELITGGCLAAARYAMDSGADTAQAIVEHTVKANNIRYRKVEKMAGFLADTFPDSGEVMTQCFGETIVGMMLKVARERGKNLRIFCPETRPYFQGARLTATVCRDMGFDVTVITDNMPAFVMEREGIDVFTCAADAISLDGHVANKIGTLQIAIAAKYMGVPVYVTGAPDVGHKTRDDIKIEMRDPEFVLQAMGVRTAADGVKGYYPAFDITPPELITGIVTDVGILSPFDLKSYFDRGSRGEFEMII